MRNLIIGVLLFASFFSFGQNQKFENWSENEIEKYKILVQLAEYVNGKETSEISNELLFEKYIEFDYVLNDTSITRKEERIKKFDALFSIFRKPIDSLGIENLDAKPIRFYKEHEIYESFNKELAKIEPNVFVYYEKDKPKIPRGTLWFDEKSNKLIAWILLNQGGYRYYLSFNFLSGKNFLSVEINGLTIMISSDFLKFETNLSK